MSADFLALVQSGDMVLERVDRFELKLNRSLPTVKSRAFADVVLNALDQIPERDRFALWVDVDNDALPISEVSATSRAAIGEHFTRYHQDNEPVQFRIEITKEVSSQRLSVYSLEALGEYLKDAPLSEALTSVSQNFQEQLILECHSDAPEDGAGSATIRFVQAGGSTSVAPLGWRNRALRLLKDNAHRTGYSGAMLPQDFALCYPTGVASLDAFMARASAVLSAMSLSNESELREDQLDYRLVGYKVLDGTVERSVDLVDTSGTFQRIAEWAYGAEGNSDKIGLARNVISLCAPRLEDVPMHPEIWGAIQSNYQIYLKENITTYLEVRNKIAELLAESTHKTHALIEGLLDSVRNGILVVLTFLLSVVVINGLKETGIKMIFSAEYLAIVLIVLVLSSFAIWASCRDAKDRFEQSATSTKALLQRIYAHVMIPTEIDEQVDPTIDDNRAYMTKQARNYFRFWLVIAIVVAVSFGTGYWYFLHVREQANKTADAFSQGVVDNSGMRHDQAFVQHPPRSGASATVPRERRQPDQILTVATPAIANAGNAVEASCPRKNATSQNGQCVTTAASIAVEIHETPTEEEMAASQ